MANVLTGEMIALLEACGYKQSDYLKEWTTIYINMSTGSRIDFNSYGGVEIHMWFDEGGEEKCAWWRKWFTFEASYDMDDLALLEVLQAVKAVTIPQNNSVTYAILNQMRKKHAQLHNSNSLIASGDSVDSSNS